MALAGAEVEKKPDQACLGLIVEVGPAKLSGADNPYYYVLPVTVQGKFVAPQKLTYYLLFRPEWFAADFKAKSIMDGTKEGEQHYRRYRQDIAARLRDKDGELIKGVRPSTLQNILGEEKFAHLAAEVDEFEGEPGFEEVGELLAKYLVGEDVLYIASQRKDGDELMDSYNIDRFLSVTDKDFEFLVKDSKNKKRKRGPLVLTWSED